MRLVTKPNSLILQTLVLCTYFLAQNASSDLAPSSMKDLIEKSDVILFARPTNIQTTDSGGYAEFAAEKSIKGETVSTFRVAWSNEVHDQEISDKKLHLLFLRRKAEGEYTGTYYGRSYWEVEERCEKGAACQLFTQYSYPINMIDIDSEYIEAGFFIENFLEQKISILCLDNIQSIVENAGKLQ